MVKSPMKPVDQAVSSHWYSYLVPQTFIKASLFKSNPLLCNHSPSYTRLLFLNQTLCYATIALLTFFVYVIQLSEVLGLLDFKAPKFKDLFSMKPPKQKNSAAMLYS